MLRSPDAQPLRRNERQIQVAFLEAPSAPIYASEAWFGSPITRRARHGCIVKNTTSRPVRALEMGWLVKDERGREFVAGSIPVDVSLAPGQKTTLVQDVTFKFSAIQR